MEHNTRLKKLLDAGKVKIANGDYKGAMVDYQECIEIDPFCAEAYFNSANILHLQGQMGKAIKAFKKTLEIDPNHTEAAISLSVVLNDIGKYDEAQGIFQNLKESEKRSGEGVHDPHINKRFALKHLELGDMYLMYQRFEDALLEYDKALKLDDENLDTRIKIAKAYSKKGFINRAIDELQHIKMEHPNYSPAKVALGLLYYSNGNVVEAQSEWQSVLLREPTNNQAKMYLSLSKNADTISI